MVAIICDYVARSQPVAMLVAHLEFKIDTDELLQLQRLT